MNTGIDAETSTTTEIRIGRHIVLASSSNYRKQLLERLDLKFETKAPDIDETALPGETPSQLCIRLAEEKARALTAHFPNHLIIGSDQVATLGNTQLDKPGNRQRAIEQLLLSSGKAVQFYTSVCVFDSKVNTMESEMDLCTVYFRKLQKGQIVRYVDKEKPLDCAGGFKAEGLGISLFERIAGEDPNALVGLPLIRLCRLLENFGVTVI